MKAAFVKAACLKAVFSTAALTGRVRHPCWPGQPRRPVSRTFAARRPSCRPANGHVALSRQGRDDDAAGRRSGLMSFAGLIADWALACHHIAHGIPCGLRPVRVTSPDLPHETADNGRRSQTCPPPRITDRSPWPRLIFHPPIFHPPIFRLLILCTPSLRGRCPMLHSGHWRRLRHAGLPPMRERPILLALPRSMDAAGLIRFGMRIGRSKASRPTFKTTGCRLIVGCRTVVKVREIG